VILQRDGQVYWLRRGDSLAFLGGFWAFPGGRQDPGDATLRHTAARELAEEIGVELPPDDRFVDIGQTVTPPWAPIRFAATYYLVEQPPGIEPTPRTAEHSAGEWTTPADALARRARGERLTSPVVSDALAAIHGGPEALRRAAAANDPSPLWELAPGVRVISVRTPTVPPATHTNCYVFERDELYVVDPASPYPEEQILLDRALDARGKPVREIWLTHHHVDHVSGAAHLAKRLGVPIAAHPVTAELLRGRVEVTRLIEDGDVTAGVRAIFTPGHAAGHLCFLDEATGFVVAGDMVAGTGTIIVDPDEGDMQLYLDSLHRLRTLDAHALLPAHGPTLANPAAKLDEYKAHRLKREALVFAALQARGPATAHELVPEVYKDVAPAIYALAERSLLAHLIKLERDGRAVQDAGGWRAHGGTIPS
jgi:glyoxylase-like metal-dependent hydrolase (beta-lactamase superfamily II)